MRRDKEFIENYAGEHFKNMPLALSKTNRSMALRRANVSAEAKIS
jgi:hypothetical protein